MTEISTWGGIFPQIMGQQKKLELTKEICYIRKNGSLVHQNFIESAA